MNLRSGRTYGDSQNQETTLQNERASKRKKTIEPVADSTKRVAPLSNSQLSSKPSELKSSTSITRL